MWRSLTLRFGVCKIFYDLSNRYMSLEKVLSNQKNVKDETTIVSSRFPASFR